MKIVQVNTVYNQGSTGKIAASLLELQNKMGIEAYIAYGRGDTPLSDHFFKIGNKLDFLGHVGINFLLGKTGYASRHVTENFLKWLDKIKPDVIHLHNIHGFYLHVGRLFQYIKDNQIPVVWTLHDCWPFTGHCAYFDYIQCNKWMDGCCHCKIHRTSYPYAIFKDNSSWNYEQKKEDFQHVRNLLLVTPSQWLADLTRQSFLKEYDVQVINNGIDLSVFCPRNESPVSEKKIILGVANVWDQRKGMEDFLKLRQLLDDSYEIVLIGVSKKQIKTIKKKYPFGITLIERTKDQKELAKWYSNAYAYVNPTWEDNFPTTNLEALACGTPVITYETGGSIECIDDNTGIIVKKGDVNGIVEALGRININRDEMRKTCREKALQYDKDEQFLKYIGIYKDLYEKDKDI